MKNINPPIRDSIHSMPGHMMIVSSYAFKSTYLFDVYNQIYYKKFDDYQVTSSYLIIDKLKLLVIHKK